MQFGEQSVTAKHLVGIYSDERYKFGDTTRGSMRGVPQVASSTMKKEGREFYRYGDVTKGLLEPLRTRISQDSVTPEARALVRR
jgi:hypothetical protein